MKHMKKFFMFIIILFLLTHCAANKNATVWTSPDFHMKQSKVYAILPFDDHNSAKYQADYPDAAEVVRDAFETAFINTQNRVVERSKLKSILSESAFAMSGMTEEKGIEVGKMLNADIVVFGTVKTFYKGSLLGPYTTVGFSVRAVNVGSGVILWKGSHTKSTSWKYDYDPAALVDEIAQDIVQELLARRDIR